MRSINLEDRASVESIKADTGMGSFDSDKIRQLPWRYLFGSQNRKYLQMRHQWYFAQVQLFSDYGILEYCWHRP
jgi:hypothetical protein